MPFHAWAVDVYDGAPSGRHRLPRGRDEEDRPVRLLPGLPGPGAPDRSRGRRELSLRRRSSRPRTDPLDHARSARGHDDDRRERPRAPPEGDEADARLLVHQPGRLHADRHRDRHRAGPHGGDAPDPRARPHEGRGVPRGRWRCSARRRSPDRRLEGPRGPSPSPRCGIRPDAAVARGHSPHDRVRLEVRALLGRCAGPGLLRLARGRRRAEQRALPVLLRTRAEGPLLRRVGRSPRPPRSSVEPLGQPFPAGGLGYGRAVAIGMAAVLIVGIGLYPQSVLGAIQSAAQHFVALGV